MTNDELIADFFEIRTSPDSLELFVCKITWDGPHLPVSNWDKVATFQPCTDPALARKAILRTLKQKKYFTFCEVCGEKKPSGWLTGATCHSCMEKMGGVF